MVVFTRDLKGMAGLESERDPVLVVHPQAPLARPIAFQGLLTVPAGQTDRAWNASGAIDVALSRVWCGKPPARP